MFYLIFKIKHSECFFNGESYLVLENGILYNRHLINTIVGKEFADSIIEHGEELNKMEFKDSELAILVPYILTSSGILLL